MNSTDRHRIHSALDAVLARRQGPLDVSGLCDSGAWAWPAPADYERLDSRAAGEAPEASDGPL